MEVYPIIDISKQDIDNYEQMGTKSKFWYTDKNNGKEYLFKSIHTEDKNQTPVIREGEDWAEKVACELADLLGIPHANYDLAINGQERGIRSENFINEGESLVFGNQFIEHVVTKVLKQDLEIGQRSQSISRVDAILEHLVILPPTNWVNTKYINSARDVFLGYVLFDTWIANQDRHNENWAARLDASGEISLAPSFDHAASLGRNESDESRKERLETKDIGRKVESYVVKCKSYFYIEEKRLKSIEAFVSFAAMNCDAAMEWLNRLESIEDSQVWDILEAIPETVMTDVSKHFCLAILQENKKRILATRDFIKKNRMEKKENSNK